MDGSGDFDHHAEWFARGWRSTYDELRGTCPVAHTPRHGGYYVVTTAADVAAVLRDTKRFSSGRGSTEEGRPCGGVTIPTNPVRMGLMEMDAPEHTEHRRRIASAFSRSAMDAYRPRIRQLVTWCIDRVIDTGRLDVVDDLANPLPALVTLDVLGLPLDRWHDYARALHEAVYRAPGSMAKVQALLADLERIVVDADDRSPGVLGLLKSAERDGGGLGDDVVVEMLYMLLSGGVDTTTALIASSLLHLSSVPADSARLQADPQVVPTAVQEMIRYYAPATGVARTVTDRVALGSVELVPGDRVLLALGSANSDEARIEDPDRVIVDRAENAHLSFGIGAHRCIGAELASAEMEVLLEEVLRRMPDLVIDPASAVPYPRTPLVSGYQTMPGSFTAALPEGPRGAEPPIAETTGPRSVVSSGAPHGGNR